MLNIKCPDCGHLKVFHHSVKQCTCNKESLSGCHFTIENEKDNWIECDCKKIY